MCDAPYLTPVIVALVVMAIVGYLAALLLGDDYD